MERYIWLQKLHFYWKTGKVVGKENPVYVDAVTSHTVREPAPPRPHSRSEGSLGCWPLWLEAKPSSPLKPFIKRHSSASWSVCSFQHFAWWLKKIITAKDWEVYCKVYFMSNICVQQIMCTSSQHPKYLEQNLLRQTSDVQMWITSLINSKYRHLCRLQGGQWCPLKETQVIHRSSRQLLYPLPIQPLNNPWAISEQ